MTRATGRPLSTRLLRSADGEGVALHDLGGSGPDLLLSHGNGLNSGMWAAAVPHLAPHFHCHGLDLRGHGAARPAESEYSVRRDRFAEDIFAAIDALGGGAIRFAGHSLGAASALFAALRKPETFRALWLFEPVVAPIGFAPPSEGPPPIAEVARHRREFFGSVDEFVQRVRSKAPYDQCDPISVAAYAALGLVPAAPQDRARGAVRLSCTAHDEARVFESGEPQDFDRFATVVCPTVVACGGASRAPDDYPQRLAPLVAQALPNALLERHRELSHFGPMERPDAIARSIVDHLADG